MLENVEKASGDHEKETHDNDSRETSSALRRKVEAVVKRVFTWEVLKPVLCGQGLSILICGTAITSNFLQEKDIKVPLTQSFFNYALLFFIYTSMLCIKKDENGRPRIYNILRLHWWKYVLIAAVDVSANYAVVSAYQFTSLTSVQLLDCFILPVVMILSYLFLKVRYVLVHYIGVASALIGVGCMVGADIIVGREGTGEAGSNPGLGDALVLGGAVLYGISNVFMEYIAKHHDSGNIEFLGMFGLFCPIFNGILLLVLERQALAAITWSVDVVFLFVGFAICMFLLYSLMPVVMRLSSATAVNISLLTADLYALFAGLFLFNDQLSALYIVSFVTIVISLVIYHSRKPLSRSPAPTDGEDSFTPRQDNESSPLSPGRGTWFSRSVNTQPEINNV